IELRYGYTTARFVQYTLTALVTLLLPAVLVVCLKRQTRRRVASGDVFAPHAFALWFVWILNGALLFWMLVIGATGLHAFLNYIDSASSWRTAIWTALGIGGVPLAAIALCTLVAYDLLSALPGLGGSRATLLRKFLIPHGRFIVPLSLFL